MVTTLAIIALALLLTGAATATVYALPIMPQVNGAQAQNGDLIQTQDRLRLQDCDRDTTQTQDRLRLRDCTQNRTRKGNGYCNNGGSESMAGHMYQNRLCEQAGVCSQNGNGSAQE